MLVEYMGELLRRPVADARERRTYDRLVGAGTYVFGLSDDLVVDATRKGVRPFQIEIYRGENALHEGSVSANVLQMGCIILPH